MNEKSLKGWNVRLKEKRLEAKISLKKAAEMTGFTMQMLIAYEKGKVAPKFDSLYRICLAYGCDFMYVVDGTVEEPYPEISPDDVEKAICYVLASGKANTPKDLPKPIRIKIGE